jgi:cell division protease FtsH
MSTLGPLSLESQSGEVFLGGGWSSRSEYSNEIAAQIDSQVRVIVDECHESALKIVQDYRQVVDRLVDILIEKETIDGDELRQIVAEYTAIPDKERFVPAL